MIGGFWDADDFRDKPYGFLTNQLGHGWVGPVMSMAPLFWWGLHPYAVPVLVAVVYWGVWEVLLQRGKMWADSLMDTANVMAGASVVCAFWLRDGWTVLACFVAWGAVLALEVWRRR